MYTMQKPSREAIHDFLSRQKDFSFSYSEVGRTRSSTAPHGYTLDHDRIELGKGRQIYERAVAALRNWKMFDTGWTTLCWPNAPIARDTVVGILVRVFPIWSLNACRIIYVIDEQDPVQKFGFAYGTLPYHGTSGEERFTVEWRASDDSAWYDIYSFSRPKPPLAIVKRLVSRTIQERFKQESLRAMARAVEITKEA